MLLGGIRSHLTGYRCLCYHPTPWPSVSANCHESSSSIFMSQMKSMRLVLFNTHLQTLFKSSIRANVFHSLLVALPWAGRSAAVPQGVSRHSLAPQGPTQSQPHRLAPQLRSRLNSFFIFYFEPSFLWTCCVHTSLWLFYAPESHL